MNQNDILSPSTIADLAAGFEADPAALLAQNAVTSAGIDAVSLNRRVVTTTDPSFSVKLDTWGVTNQKRSGRCWIFAGLNVLRAHVMKDLDLDGFELSQNYLHFWDKLEKANYFLTSMVELADRDVDDRTVHEIMADPIGDGGQWDMFAALVEKYGVVPKYAMPESESSSHTAPMNDALCTLLRRGGLELRRLVVEGADPQPRKAELVREVHRVLSIHLGTPPASFVWQYRAKGGEFTRVGELTPQQFAEQVIDVDVADYVCLVNDPRHDYGTTMTVDQLGNVVEGSIRYLNVEADVLKQAALQQLREGHPVWFGCCVGKQFNRDLGIWDQQLFTLDAVYGVQLGYDKADRMRTCEEAMDHAMVLTGVDEHEGEIRRWRVENSWSDEKGDKGFMTMNDNWFAEHLFELAVPASTLPPELRSALGNEPIVLPRWDPMGTLAD